MNDPADYSKEFHEHCECLATCPTAKQQAARIRSLEAELADARGKLEAAERECLLRRITTANAVARITRSRDDSPAGRSDAAKAFVEGSNMALSYVVDLLKIGEEGVVESLAQQPADSGRGEG